MNIKSPFIETSYDKKTSTSFILINNTTHTRTIFNIEPEEFHLKKYEYDIDPNVIYIDGYEYSASTTALNKYQKAISVMDASAPTKEMMALAREVNYILCSIEFAEGVAGAKIDFNNPVTLLTVYKRVKERYPNNEIVITLKEKGALYCINNEIKQMPPLSVKEIDRTGAGDIFRAAFTYAIGQGYDLEKAIRVANIAGGLSTSRLGGKDSIPILSEVIQNYESRFGAIAASNTQTQAAQQPPQTPQAQMPVQNAQPSAKEETPTPPQA